MPFMTVLAGHLTGAAIGATTAGVAPSVWAIVAKMKEAQELLKVFAAFGLPQIDVDWARIPFIGQLPMGTVQVGPAEKLDDKTVDKGDGSKVQTIWIVQKVADSRYLGHGNLVDFIKAIRSGQETDFNKFSLAMLDVGDALTGQALRPFLLQYKLAPHTKNVYAKQEIEKRQATASETSAPNPNHTVTTDTTFTEVTVKETVYAPVSPDENVGAVPDPSKLTVDKEQKLTYVEGRRTTTDTKITVETTDTKSPMMLGWDLGKLLGRETVSTTSTVITVTHETIQAIVQNGDLMAAYRRGEITAEEALKKVEGTPGARKKVAEGEGKVTQSGPETTFSEGWLAQAPGVGGAVTIGAKVGMGVAVSGQDVFWAALDAVDIVTMGGSVAVKNAGKVVIKKGLQKLPGVAIRDAAGKMLGTSGKAAAGRLKEEAVEQGAKVSSKSPSQILGQNLRDKGIPRPSPEHDAHHIVAVNHPKAAPARKILEKFGIDINSAQNGVWLDSKVHAGVHTNDYYNRVNTLLRQAGSKEDVFEVFEQISKELSARAA
jgi:hypothetical protein